MLRGSVAVFLPALVVGLAPNLTLAQPSSARTATSALTAADLARIKDELREEVKAELREELRQEFRDDLKAEFESNKGQSSGSPSTDADWDTAGGDESWSDESWAEEEWKWEEPAKPELNFIELDGYFRIRYDMFSNLDLNTFYRNNADPANPILFGPFAPNFAPTTPLCETDFTPLTDEQGNVIGNGGCGANLDPRTIGTANMRLRLEPTLNVYEDIRIRSRIDILDNLILGSTPDTLLANPNAPISVLSNGQVAPVDGVNSVWADSIRVKQVWAEIQTPLGQLRVGRMPDHFGIGTTANDGSGLDMDFGDTVDRLMFITKIGDFHVIPSFDWAATGPSSAIRFQPAGQPFDRDQRDDVDQYMLAIVRQDSEEDIKRKLENDMYVLNYGVRFAGRFQAYDTPRFFSTIDDPTDPDGTTQPVTNVEDQATIDQIIRREASLGLYTIWMRFIRRNLTIEAEHAGVFGTIGSSALSGTFDNPQAGSDNFDVLQFGGSVRLEYRLLKNALKLELLMLVASGDPAPGWGLQPLNAVPNNPSIRQGAWDGNQVTDGKLSNFAFDPDYYVDMILWRQLVGAVTDAFVFRPSLQYNFTESIGTRLDIIYSRALFASSTPSGSFRRAGFNDDNVVFTDSDLGEPDANLGIEGNFKLFYASATGLNAWFQYGLLIPLAGLDREVLVENAGVADSTDPVTGNNYRRLGASIAHTIQLMLGISF